MKILFIQTGGTIDKDYPQTTKGYAFEISEPAISRILERANPLFEHEIISVLKKDSLDITEEDREKIYAACKEAKADKIIITHGTDALIETANKLCSIKNKVIVITGAMKPERFYNSDAHFNMGLAVGAIQTLKNGIYIAMNGQIIPAEKAERNLKTGQFLSK